MADVLKAGRGLERRPLNLRDAKALFPLVEANRERLRRWLPWPDANRSVLDTRAFILRVRAHARAGIGQSFGVWWKGALVGTAGFVWIDAANHSAAIGYWLAQEAEGHGDAVDECESVVVELAVLAPPAGQKAGGRRRRRPIASRCCSTIAIAVACACWARRSLSSRVMSRPSLP